MKKEYIAPAVEKMIFDGTCSLLKGSAEDPWADAKDNNVQSGDDDNESSWSAWED